MVASSLLGVRLMVLTGENVPKPPPPAVIGALAGVTVTSDASAGDVFQMSFALGRDKAADFDLLTTGAVDPFTRVVIAAVFGVVPEVLIDGIVTHHSFAASSTPGQTMLTVTGKDVSVMLDLDEHNAPHKNQADSVIVSARLANYPQYRFVQAVTQTTDVPLEINSVPRQRETDFALIRRLALANGFVFYVEPAAVGFNTAYWGLENRLGVPQPALTVGMGAASNVDSMSFTNDALAPVGATGSVVEPITKTSIPLPSLPSLRLPPLAARPVQAKRTEILRDTANQNPLQGALKSAATATRAKEPITASGEVDVAKYGRALRTRQLVGVRGVGNSYDGNYYVTRTTHTIGDGSFKTGFTLSRDGLGALLPVVVP